jgi:hypothetical protein
VSGKMCRSYFFHRGERGERREKTEKDVEEAFSLIFLGLFSALSAVNQLRSAGPRSAGVQCRRTGPCSPRRRGE